MPEKQEEKGKSWWKYALAGYAAKTAIDSEVDNRVNHRLDEIKEELRKQEEEQQLNARYAELGKTAQGRKLISLVKKALKTVEEGVKKAEDLESRKEQLEKQVRLLENRVEYKKQVNNSRAVWLDIFTLGGAKHLYLKTGIRLKRLKTEQSKNFLLTDNKNLLRNWILKLLWIAILITTLFSGQTATQEDKTGLVLWIIATVTISAYLTYLTARELNDNMENFEKNRKELTRTKNELSSTKREYKTLETTFTNAQNFLEETYATLKS